MKNVRNIAVAAGGNSTERQVSIVSGLNVCGALRERGHRAVLVDAFTGAGLPEDGQELFPSEYDVEAAAACLHSFDGRIEEMTADPGRGFFAPGMLDFLKKADIVFLALHGQNGEDGRIQAALDLEKIPYTGSGHLGSAIAMNKNLSKRIVHDGGVPTAAWVTYLKKDYEEAGCRAPEPEALGMQLPLVVKVNCGGSSVGVYICNTREEYHEAFEKAFALENVLVIEEYISGREFSVGVIDGKALPVIEIAPKNGFYDYTNKYTQGMTVETCPAELEEEPTKRMQRFAERGYELLHLNAYGRLDFLMKEDGSMYFLEANTLPGMTPLSLLPQEAAAAGMDFGTLCEKLIDFSFKERA